MKLPFTRERFVDVFRKYNETVFPVQFVFYVALVFLAFQLVGKKTNSSRFISYTLAFFWLWMGLVYHIVFFSVINKAAYLFGTMFILQGLLFLKYAKTLSFQFTKDLNGLTAILFLAYALIVYPILGYAIGHTYPGAPTFGLPCPTTIFTFGVLLLSDKRVPIPILIIPSLWSIIGTSAAFSLGFTEDFGLLFAAVASIILISRKNKAFRSVV